MPAENRIRMTYKLTGPINNKQNEGIKSHPYISLIKYAY